MADVKKVFITVSSSVENLDDYGLVADVEKNKTESTGLLKYDGGSAHLSYKQKGEGGEVVSEIEIKDGAVFAKNRGAISSDMEFVEKKRFVGVYGVPPFSFDMEILPIRVRSDISDSCGSAEILYEMTIGGAKKRTKMSISYRTGAADA